MSDLTAVKKENKPKFTPIQESAIAHEGSDLLISAGAGSGKTATLTERIVRRVIDGKDISRMLVVTYTKDASNELKVRIAKKLAEKLKEKPNDPHLMSQLVRVTSADISTIHSFCLKTIRPYFDKLSIDSDFKIGEESEIAIIKNEAMAEVIDSYYEDESIDNDFRLVSNCYSEFTNENALGEQLISLYNKLISTSDSIETLITSKRLEGDFINSDFGQVILKQINMVIDHYVPLYERCIDMINDDGELAQVKFLDAYASDLDYIKRLKGALQKGTYQQICSLVKSFKAVALTRHKYDGALDVDFLKATRDKFKTELNKLSSGYLYVDDDTIKAVIEQNNKICGAIYRILKKFEVEFQAKKRAHSLCDFNDLERLTLKLLYNEDGTPSVIAKEVSSRYDELYIDEYQDNNSVQDKIFRAISRGNRFMVGDIKQSIYRFRSAEPEIFSSYRQDFTKPDSAGRALFMSNNFRCDENIIDFTNIVSDCMFKHSYGFDYQGDDKLIFSKKYDCDITPQATEICLIDTNELESDVKETIQAEFVAKKIKSLLDSGTLPDGRRIKRSDIAILLKTVTRHIGKYIDALDKYGITSEYVQESSFFEKPHILLMLCILNAIDNPSRDTYLAGALRSRIFGFSLEDLIRVRKNTERDISFYSSLLTYSKKGKTKERIDDFLKKLNTYKREISKMASHEAISYIMNETGFISKCNYNERHDLIRLYNIARQFERNSFKGLYSFLRHVDNLSANGGKEAVSEDPYDSVKIMSMHKSKGLEYEICFLCDLEGQFNLMDSQEPILFERNLGITGYVSLDDGLIQYNNVLRKCTSLALRHATSEEQMRLLYVAMTRARSKLYLVANVKEPQVAYEKYLKNYEFISPLTVYSAKSHIEYVMMATPIPHRSFDIQYIDASTLEAYDRVVSNDAKEINEEQVDSIYHMLKSRFEFDYRYKYLEKIPSKLSVSRLYPEVLDNEENDEIKVDFDLESVPVFLSGGKSKITGAQRGTATHVFMQFCDFNRLVELGYDVELKRLVDNSFISKEVAEIINREHIEKFIRSDLLRELLSSKRLLREFRFNVMLDAKEFTTDERLNDEKVLVQGVTDCIYENEQGELVLVDYKTDFVTEDNYRTVLLERHSNQLSYYKRACDLMFDKPISKVVIYSVPLAKEIEVE
ncbi:MAG: helicase-exonuclease AddAB subunit AddA [Clostridia bacterium]|nr:helicase-exonuclease AddAB subunit AddA [Clostridia bacterium]